jgi:tetratricopeptide (TPR) repeat protein
MGFFSRTLSRLDELKRVLTRDPASRQFLALADEYRRQGKHKEAIEVLQGGLAQNPSAVAGHVALGRLLQQNGRLDEALDSFHAALKLDPQNLVALRQTADLHLSRGDKVEAIKKLKLFRGLSPGERDVNELIRQLDDELAAASPGRVLVREEPVSPPLPAPELRTGPVSRATSTAGAPASSAAASPPAGLPEVPPLPMSGRGKEAGVDSEAAVPDVLRRPEGLAAVRGAAPDRGLAPGGAEAPSVPESWPPVPAVGSIELTAPAEPAASPETLHGPDSSSSGRGAGPGVLPPLPDLPFAAETPAVPSATETLAELLRAQGHLADAGKAYRELARSEPDAARAGHYLGIAREISASSAGTVRGRLEAWGEPFARSLGARDADLVKAVEEVVQRLGASAAVVTDFEGVPVVTAGPHSEADAMENLAAELTAFWKNVRRSQKEIGEGALDSLVLSGSAGTAAVKLITPAYALLLKVGPGVPAGRIRFEAVRAAEQLRPALL